MGARHEARLSIIPSCRRLPNRFPRPAPLTLRSAEKRLHHFDGLRLVLAAAADRRQGRWNVLDGARMVATFGRGPELALGASPFRRVLHAASHQLLFGRVVAREDRHAPLLGRLRGRSRRGRGRTNQSVIFQK